MTLIHTAQRQYGSRDNYAGLFQQDKAVREYWCVLIRDTHYIYMHTGQGCDYLITMPYTQTVGDK